MILADTALHSVLWLVVHPADEPRASVPGRDPHRLLVFGNFLAVGWGVPSHQVALPGQLARAVAARTGRGAEVEVVGAESITSSTAKKRIELLKLRWYDGVVVSIGLSDALRLTPPRRWRQSMNEFLRAVVEQTPASTPIIVTSIVPVRRVVIFRGFFGIAGDRHAATLNAIMEELCAEHDTVSFVTLPALILQGEEKTAVAFYANAADLIAGELSVRLPSSL